MTEHDDFFERLRADARPLRHQPDQVQLARIRARILATIEERPTVADMLAAWFRPVLATVAMLAAVAVFTLTSLNGNNEESSYEQVEIVMAGDSYVVGN